MFYCTMKLGCKVFCKIAQCHANKSKQRRLFNKILEINAKSFTMPQETNK